MVNALPLIGSFLFAENDAVPASSVSVSDGSSSVKGTRLSASGENFTGDLDIGGAYSIFMRLQIQ